MREILLRLKSDVQNLELQADVIADATVARALVEAMAVAEIRIAQAGILGDGKRGAA